MKKKTFHEDIQAMRQAAKYGLVYEYMYARRIGLTPAEALDEWDLWERDD